VNFQPQLAGAQVAPHKVSNPYPRVFAQPGSSMKRFVSRTLLLVSSAIGLWATAFFLYARPVLAGDDSPQVIEVTAKKYEYSPAPIHVKRGAKIELKINAIDHDHGFSVFAVPDGANSNGPPGLVFTSPQECWQLKKGETTTIEFLAQTPGTYSFKCCHVCGLGHRGMKGQLVVDK